MLRPEFESPVDHGFVIKDLRNKRSTSNNFLLATIQSFQKVIPAPLQGLDEIGGCICLVYGDCPVASPHLR